MCRVKGITARRSRPRFVRCQSILQRPPDIGTQNNFFGGVAREWW